MRTTGKVHFSVSNRGTREKNWFVFSPKPTAKLVSNTHIQTTTTTAASIQELDRIIGSSSSIEIMFTSEGCSLPVGRLCMGIPIKLHWTFFLLLVFELIDAIFRVQLFSFTMLIVVLYGPILLITIVVHELGTSSFLLFSLVVCSVRSRMDGYVACYRSWTLKRVRINLRTVDTHTHLLPGHAWMNKKYGTLERYST